MRTKTTKATKKVVNNVTTKRKTVSVPVQAYTIVATQDTVVTGRGANKSIVTGATRFALLKGNDLVATSGNKKLNPTKFNKSYVKSVVTTVLPAVKKLVKTGELTL